METTYASMYGFDTGSALQPAYGVETAMASASGGTGLDPEWLDFVPRNFTRTAGFGLLVAIGVLVYANIRIVNE